MSIKTSPYTQSRWTRAEQETNSYESKLLQLLVGKILTISCANAFSGEHLGDTIAVV